MDVDLFSPEAYPSGSGPSAPAAERPWTEGGVQDELSVILKRRFPHNESAVCAGLALFNDAPLRQYVPDARLRAALVALKGTFAEAAIDSIRSGFYDSVAFAPLPDDIIAISRTFSANGSHIIQFNTAYGFETLRPLACILAHEALHQESDSSCREERMITTLETFLYGVFVSEDPTLAHVQTDLTRRHNTRLLALLNSRGVQGDLRVNESQGNVFPGGRPLETFFSAFTCFDGGVTSVGNRALQSFVLGLTGVFVADAAFDQATEEIIDHHQVVLDPEDIVRIAEVGLHLNTSCFSASNSTASAFETAKFSSSAFGVSDRKCFLSVLLACALFLCVVLT
jgi:hypothetical protein